MPAGRDSRSRRGPLNMEEDQVSVFGVLPDGDPVRLVRLSGGGLSVEVLSFGATIRALQFGGQPMVLSLDRLEDYTGASGHMGAVAGRFANRINGGRFGLDDSVHQLTCNEAGITHLHGGARGFGRRNWRLVDVGPKSVSLAHDAADGEEGYPGALAATCTYSIPSDGVLEIRLEATCDRPTIVNLATHSYFNLDGGGDIGVHRLEIPADRYLPVDAHKIPTGQLADVAGTVFDFRRARTVGDHPYDHAFVLAGGTTATPRRVARLVGGRSGVTLDIESTEPALQFYDGHNLNAGPHAGRAGLCLEPQRFPDAPNQPAFPSAVLRPGETYRQVTRYRFSRQDGE